MHSVFSFSDVLQLRPQRVGLVRIHAMQQHRRLCFPVLRFEPHVGVWVSGGQQQLDPRRLHAEWLVPEGLQEPRRRP